MVKVYLDDCRPTPAGWVPARWPEEVIRLLEQGDVAQLSLDHDLGDDAHGTGYDVQPGSSASSSSRPPRRVARWWQRSVRFAQRRHAPVPRARSWSGFGSAR